MQDKILKLLEGSDKALSADEIMDELGLSTVDDLKNVLKDLNDLEDNLKVYLNKTTVSRMTAMVSASV